MCAWSQLFERNNFPLWILSNVGYECSSIPRTQYSTGSSSFMQYSNNRSSHFSHGHVRKEWRGFQTSSFIYVPQTTAKPVRFSDLEPANGHVMSESASSALSILYLHRNFPAIENRYSEWTPDGIVIYVEFSRRVFFIFLPSIVTQPFLSFYL